MPGPDLAAFTNAQAAQWLFANAPVTTAGYGRNFAARLGELLDAVRLDTRQRSLDDAATAVDILRTDLEAMTRHSALSEATVLVDDAVALGEDPKAAIVRERDRGSGRPGPGTPPTP